MQLFIKHAFDCQKHVIEIINGKLLLTTIVVINNFQLLKILFSNYY